jgi:hypothetical protein
LTLRSLAFAVAGGVPVSNEQHLKGQIFRAVAFSDEHSNNLEISRENGKRTIFQKGGEVFAYTI